MAIKNRKARNSVPVTGRSLTGKCSWFGGPGDSTDSGHTALGLTTATPGIAVYDESTLGGYWLVHMHSNGVTKVVRQTDKGPAPWTGRIVDFTYSLLPHFKYTTSNFPTDSTVTITYLGKDKQAAITAAGADAVGTGAASTGTDQPADPSATARDVSLLDPGSLTSAGDALSILKDLLTGNIGDLGSKFALASLQVVKNVTVGFFDLIVAPAWHWNQRAVAYYSTYVLDPRRVADSSSEFQWAFAWTAVFWAGGYALLWLEEDNGKLTPVPVRRARLGRHVKRAQSLPARRSLVKPGEVKEHTPQKPKIVTTSAPILRVGTMTATRPRPVRVTRETHARTGEPEPITTEARITRVNFTAGSEEHSGGTDAGESHSQRHRGEGTPRPSRDHPQGPSKAGQ